METGGKTKQKQPITELSKPPVWPGLVWKQYCKPSQLKDQLSVSTLTYYTPIVHTALWCNEGGPLKTFGALFLKR